MSTFYLHLFNVTVLLSTIPFTVLGRKMWIRLIPTFIFASLTIVSYLFSSFQLGSAFENQLTKELFVIFGYYVISTLALSIVIRLFEKAKFIREHTEGFFTNRRY